MTDPKTKELIDRVIEVIIFRSGKYSSGYKDWQIIEKIQSQYKKIENSTLLLEKSPPGCYRDSYENEDFRIAQLLKVKTCESIVRVPRERATRASQTK